MRNNPLLARPLQAGAALSLLTWLVAGSAQARTYSVLGLDSEEHGSVDFSQPSPGDAGFSPAAMRRKASR